MKYIYSIISIQIRYLDFNSNYIQTFLFKDSVISREKKGDLNQMNCLQLNQTNPLPNERYCSVLPQWF